MEKPELKEYFYKPFYSQSFYSSLFKEGCGRVFLVILLITVLGTVSYMPKVSIFLDNIFSYENLKQIPNLKIEKGSLSADVKMPYVLRSKEAKDIVVIDTSGNIDSFEKTASQVIITKKNIMIKQRHGRISIYELKNINTMLDKDVVEVNGETLMALYKTVKIPVMIAFFVVFLLVFYVWRAFLVLFYSLFVLALKGGRNIEYSNVLSISGAAMIPSIYLSIFFSVTNSKMPYPFLYMLITAGYIFFAMKKREEDSNIGTKLDS
jgi:hypothetical protein